MSRQRNPQDSKYRQADWNEPLLFEMSVSGKIAHRLPAVEDEVKKLAGPLDAMIPAGMRRNQSPNLPEISELQVVRHFTRLSQMNFSVSSGIYPLGSCTMKYNPLINEQAALNPGLAWLHPYQDVSTCQGALELMWELEQWLAELSGMDAVTLQPPAGAAGEFAGVMIIRVYHKHVMDEGDQRKEMLIPDAAHGTNPASAAMAGFKIVVLPSSNEGLVDLDALKAASGPQTAGLMLTNPNTIGVFEKDIGEIAGIIHDSGGLLYYDGANLNAIMGISRPGDMGFDVMHMNLHKTFSTPHGGGGPGSGAVGVKEKLTELLPVPRIVKAKDGRFDLNYNLPRSIGKVHGFYGNFGVLVRAYTYICALGKEGLRRTSETAVLNANYIAHHISQIRGFSLPYSPNTPRMHECVISAENLAEETGVTATHVAKRLLDLGLHSPTMYFPLIVPEALMIEPTESESKEDLDLLIGAFKQISNEAYSNPDIVKSAPHSTALHDLDEYRAAHPKTLTLSWRMHQKRTAK